MVLADSDRISHVPPYSGYWYLITHFTYRAITSIAQLSNWFCYTLTRMSQSYNPKIAETILVWAISTSLATTTEITFVFFSCAYLDVSVRRVSSPYGVSGLQPDGFPHSEMHGSINICFSPCLIAAYHVLLRLSEPRHPPCALSNLLVSFWFLFTFTTSINSNMSMNSFCNLKPIQ